MTKKDYYSILEVSKNATQDEIKKNYRRLALIYHPDKTKGNEEATNKFKELGEAYGVLSNEDKKRQYDLMGNDYDDNIEEMDDPFHVFNNIFQEHMQTFMNMRYDDDLNINSIFNNITGMDNADLPFGNIHIRVHTFPVDISSNNSYENIKNKYDNNNNNEYNDEYIYEHNHEYNDDNIKNLTNPFSNISGIFSGLFKNLNKQPNKNEKIKNKYKYNEKQYTNKHNEKNKNEERNNNKHNNKNNDKSPIIMYNKPDILIYTVETTLQDIYDMKTHKITITRKRLIDGYYIDKKKKIEIPLYAKEIILSEQGDQLENYKEKGDVLINILNKKDENFKRINEYDILTFINIPLNKLYSSYSFELVLPNKEVLFVQTEKMNLNKTLLQKINKKGLPYKNDNDENNQNNDWSRGNLYIMYNVEYPNEINDLKNILFKDDESNINDYYHIAYNCDVSEIFND